MGCHEIVNRNLSLTDGSVLCFVRGANPSPSFEGLRAPKESRMYRTIAKLALLALAIASLAMILGTEPWGPA
jgi:hypothetical protein